MPCVCMCVCVCACVYVCMYVCVYVRTAGVHVCREKERERGALVVNIGLVTQQQTIQITQLSSQYYSIYCMPTRPVNT